MNARRCLGGVPSPVEVWVEGVTQFRPRAASHNPDHKVDLLSGLLVRPWEHNRAVEARFAG